VLTV
jgi:hypothetical protein